MNANPKANGHIIAPLHITADCAVSIKGFTDAICALETRGAAKTVELEEARSYAVEALRALLSANPQLFDYQQRLDAIFAAQRKK